MGNGKFTMSIFTSTGFQNLTTKAYADALVSIQPDIAIPLADIPFSKRRPVAKKQLRMAERTEEWLEELFREFDRKDPSEQPSYFGTALFAPILPFDQSMQWEYLSRLGDENWSTRLSGLTITDTNIIPDIQSCYPTLSALPRLSVEPIATPQQALQQINLGVDLLTLPFLNEISDSGVAMTFTFPPPPISLPPPPPFPTSTATTVTKTMTTPSPPLLPLGTNLWEQSHENSLEPLVESCPCYACTSHHRAFIHHLLNAREMLAWVLLQIHNFHVMDSFFASVRAMLLNGQQSFPSEAYEEACRFFALRYESRFPKGTGERPRARGYNFKSPGGGPKINGKPWGKYPDYGRGEEADPTNNEGKPAGRGHLVPTEDLSDSKVSETPAVPHEGMDSKDLAEG